LSQLDDILTTIFLFAKKVSETSDKTELCVISVDVDCHTGENRVLIQRHIEPPTTASFNRSWADFKAGFCDSSGNYWIGNDKLYTATSNQGPKRRKLIVELTATDDSVSLFRNKLSYTTHNVASYIHYLQKPDPCDIFK